jgi:drug/metabolite transporter (DMT)-like permease
MPSSFVIIARNTAKLSVDLDALLTHDHPVRGALLCLVSAAGFATLGVFGRLASDAGASIASTLLVRFALASLVFAALLAATGGLPGLRRLPRRVVVGGLMLGAAGYSLQSGLYFAAIGRLEVSLVALILYTYPAFVTLAALALGRAQPSMRTAVALAMASFGVVLVLLAAGVGELDATGALLALGSSITYTTYILISDRVVGAVEPFALSALVLTGATVAFAAAGLATGSLDLALGGEAWLWLVLIAIVSTVLPVSAFFAGLRRVGPSEAAILSTCEPPITVALAFLALGETLTAPQLAGGALVLAAVILLARTSSGSSTGVTDGALQLPARRVHARTRRTALRPAPATSAASGRDVSSV